MMRRLLLAALAALVCVPVPAAAQRFVPTPAPTSPAGVRATVDLPASQHLRNTGGSDGPRGPGSGSGLCVFTSIEHAGRWQNVPVLIGFQQWMTRKPGGGYPEKVDQMLAAYCRERGVPVPAYLQHTGGDESVLDLAARTDRMACVTYDGRDGFYSGNVYHMVNQAHLDATTAAIVDNNRPGVWLWMSRADYLSRWRGSNGGWGIVLLDSPPPPYSSPPGEVRHEWVGSGPAPAGFTAGLGCACNGALPCECGPACRCEPRAVFGQCPGGRCPIVPPDAVPLSLAGPRPIDQAADPAGAGVWTFAPDGRAAGYWLGGHRVYDLDAAGNVRRTDATGFGTGDPIDPPVPLPAGFVAPARGNTTTGESVPTGVVPGRVHSSPAYSLSGQPCTREEAHAAIAAGNLLDDSGHWHLTAVGDAALCAKVRADVAALPADVRAKLLVQCYAPDTWPVSQFALPGGVSLRAPSPGRVGPQLGAVPAAEYGTAGKMLPDVLAVAGGPLPPKAPTPPAPAPAPKPTPDPTPPPVPPLPVPSPNQLPWLIAVVLALFVIFRRPA